MATRGQAVTGFAAGWPFAAEAANDLFTAHTTAHGSEQPAPAPCSVPGCGGDGRFSLNSRAACSLGCLETLMRSTMLEEQTYATEASLKLRTRVRIGSILVDQGVITEAQLERALRAQMSAGAGRLGCWLKQQGNLSEADFAAALAIQWRCPVFRLGTFSPGEMTSLLPRWLVEDRGAIPLRLSGQPQRLALAFEDHVDHELIQAMERMLGIGVDPGLLTASDFWHATRELLSVRFPLAARQQVISLDGMVEALSRALAEAGAGIARMVVIQGSCWLRFWVASSYGGLVPRDVLCESHPNAAHLDASYEDGVENLYRATLRLAE